MNQFQTETHRDLRELANEFQLEGYRLVESENGIEYKNFLSRTVFTVYHDRLDHASERGIEIAIGKENLSEEVSLGSSAVDAWVSQLQQICSSAESKGPHFWPRVALTSKSEVDTFCQRMREIYTGDFAEAEGFSTGKNRGRRKEPIDERVLQETNTRRGQPAFRAALIQSYGCCAISRCEDVAALEAAHLRPHAVEDDYRTRNGVLLRADIHTLFDLRLISINPQTGAVVVSPKLGPTYQQFSGRPVHLPEDQNDHPDPTALMEHFAQWSAEFEVDS